MPLLIHVLQGISPVHLTLLDRQFSQAFDIRCRDGAPDCPAVEMGDEVDCALLDPSVSAQVLVIPVVA
jgi:hypothetical protein